MAINHNVTVATARHILKIKTNYNLHEKLETNSLRWPAVNTHTINIIEIKCKSKSLASSVPHNLQIKYVTEGVFYI